MSDEHHGNMMTWWQNVMTMTMILGDGNDDDDDYKASFCREEEETWDKKVHCLSWSRLRWTILQKRHLHPTHHRLHHHLCQNIIITQNIENCENWELFFAKQILNWLVRLCHMRLLWLHWWQKIKLYCKDATFQWVKVLLCPKKWLKSIYSGFGHSFKDLFVTWVNWKEHFQKLKMSYLVDVFLAITQLDYLGLSWITLDHLCFTWTANIEKETIYCKSFYQ